MTEPARRASLKFEDWQQEFPLPPEPIRMRFLGLMTLLAVDWRTVVEMRDHERRFRREIIRWIMGDPIGGHGGTALDADLTRGCRFVPLPTGAGQA